MTPCSIIVLTYNSMKTLPQCLGSLLPTLGPEDEVILIDNASTDGTADHLRCLEGIDPRLRMVYNPRNLGYSAGCNLGLRAAKNEYVALLNPDTILRPGWLAGLRRRFANDAVGAVGPVSNYVAGAQFVGHHLPPDAEKRGLLSHDELAALLRQHHGGHSLETKLLIGFCVMLRRSLLEKVGMLDEDLFLGSDDLELSWRLRRHGYTLLIAADVYVEHLGGASFRTLPTAEKQRLLDESTRVLAGKLEAYYGRGKVPSSVELWGLDIFKPPAETN